jgi:hypothetical protein
MVTNVVDGLDVAGDVGQHAGQLRGAAAGRRPAHPGELVTALGRHGPAGRLLVLGEDVNGERPGRPDARPGRRPLARAEADKRRVERHREERADGEPTGHAVFRHRGDDGHPGRKVAEDMAEKRRVGGRGAEVSRQGGRGSQVVHGLPSIDTTKAVKYRDSKLVLCQVSPQPGELAGRMRRAAIHSENPCSSRTAALLRARAPPGTWEPGRRSVSDTSNLDAVSNQCNAVTL